jgi:FAD/FMN-containing dehydrogenase
VLIPSAVVITTPSVGGGGRRTIVAFEGSDAAVERQNRDLLKMAEGKGGKGDAKVGRDAMFLALRGAVDPTNGFGSETLALKVCVPTMQGTSAYSAIEDLSVKGSVKTKMALLAGNGVLFVYATEANPEVLIQFFKGIKDVASGLGGHVIPVSGPRAVLAEWGPRLDPVIERQVLKPIKQMLDPKGILLPLV